jgi:hypothetical protein
MKKAFFFFVFVSLSLLTGCDEIQNNFLQNTIRNSGITVKQEVNFTNFSEIDIKSGFELFLKQDGTESILIVTDQDVLPYIEYFRKGDKITFRMKNGYQAIRKSVQIFISAKNISELSGSGGSSLVAESVLEGNKIKLVLSGGSSFTGKINVDKMHVLQSGGSNSKISGSTVNLNAKLSGGSELIGPDYVVEYLDLDFSGGSNANLTVTGELLVSGSGGSKLKYSGGGLIVKSSLSGGSSIKVN